MELAPATGHKPFPKPLGLLGRDEMNLAEFPITLLTNRVPKDQKEAIYQDEIYDDRSGLTLTRKLTIQAGNCGLTTAIDDEVILALIQLTKIKNEFTSKQVAFTRHELLKTLGWSDAGLNYNRIETSLDRWTSVYLKYENAWRDNRTKTWKSVGFHIIDNYELNDSRPLSDQLELIPSFIVWNQIIFESFQAGYLKPLDYDLCMGLSNSTAKRLYRFLDKRFHHKPDWMFDLKELAHEHIGLGRNYEGTAHLKRKLLPAIAELEAIGFLLPLADSDRFPSQDRHWKIRLIQKSPAPEMNAGQALAAPQPPPLAAELVKRGVSDKTAADLVQRHPAEAIQLKIDVFDWLAEKQDKRIAKSPEGYLVKSIADDYKAPKGFTSRADRDRQAEAKRQAEQAAAAERRRQQEEEARQQEQRREEDDRWSQMTPEQQAELEAKALADASEEARQTYLSLKKNRMGDGYLSILRREYIRTLIDAEKVAEPA